MDALAAAAGVTKKTLYDRFGSKDRLVAAYLAERDARWRAWLAGAVGPGGPREQVLRVLDALGEWLEREPARLRLRERLSPRPAPRLSGTVPSPPRRSPRAPAA